MAPVHLKGRMKVASLGNLNITVDGVCSISCTAPDNLGLPDQLNTGRPQEVQGLHWAYPTLPKTALGASEVSPQSNSALILCVLFV
jgi:hypothetical protein